jgi:hypothetical protein
MMNYTTNINSFFDCVIQDNCLLPSHISMYVSLFQLWRINEFRTPFRICRKELMKLSKIKSFATYHKCIRELHHAGYINYCPNYNSYKGSLIEIRDLGNNKVLEIQSVQEQNYFSDMENIFSIPKFNEVELYFNERDLPSFEANEFYSFYESRQWKLSDKKLMKNWRAAARNWIYKTEGSLCGMKASSI